MTRGLIRHQQCGCLHFITFSCYHRQPYLDSGEARDLFESSLESMRRRYAFVIIGYVVMPEHVHLLVGEPAAVLLSKAIQALKLSVSVKRRQRPFWQARYYDFNVHSEAKRVEKLRYMHRNPVKRGLVSNPEDWPWSSFRRYRNALSGARSAGPRGQHRPTGGATRSRRPVRPAPAMPSRATAYLFEKARL